MFNNRFLSFQFTDFLKLTPLLFSFVSSLKILLAAYKGFGFEGTLNEGKTPAMFPFIKVKNENHAVSISIVLSLLVPLINRKEYGQNY